jgi:hypothetical protein
MKDEGIKTKDEGDSAALSFVLCTFSFAAAVDDRGLSEIVNVAFRRAACCIRELRCKRWARRLLEEAQRDGPHFSIPGAIA